MNEACHAPLPESNLRRRSEELYIPEAHQSLSNDVIQPECHTYTCTNKQNRKKNLLPAPTDEGARSKVRTSRNRLKMGKAETGSSN